MYAVGGQDGVSCLYIVEKYDPQENRWFRVASMSSRRLGVGVAVLDGYLYAIGGSDGTSPLNTVEKYDPKTNRWSPVAPMGTRRKHLGAALFQDKLYVGKILERALMRHCCLRHFKKLIIYFHCPSQKAQFPDYNQNFLKLPLETKWTFVLEFSHLNLYHLDEQFESDLH